MRIVRFHHWLSFVPGLKIKLNQGFPCTTWISFFLILSHFFANSAIPASQPAQRTRYVSPH